MSFLSKTLICASLALLGSQAAMADTLKIGTEGGYPTMEHGGRSR